MGEQIGTLFMVSAVEPLVVSTAEPLVLSEVEGFMVSDLSSSVVEELVVSIAEPSIVSKLNIEKLKKKSRKFRLFRKFSSRFPLRFFLQQAPFGSKSSFVSSLWYEPYGSYLWRDVEGSKVEP